MNDSELIKEFIRIVNNEMQIQILVCKIEWNEGPHKPVSIWVIAKNLPAKSSESEIQYATTQVLHNMEYFSKCSECGERNPVGWMNDDHICQGCAQANHGIVY